MMEGFLSLCLFGGWSVRWFTTRPGHNVSGRVQPKFWGMCCEVGWGARVYGPVVFVVCQLHARLWPASCLFPVAHWLPAVAAELAKSFDLVTGGCKSCACKDASMLLPRPLQNVCDVYEGLQPLRFTQACALCEVVRYLKS